jgi:hypothetical protein
MAAVAMFATMVVEVSVMLAVFPVVKDGDEDAFMLLGKRGRKAPRAKSLT